MNKLEFQSQMGRLKENLTEEFIKLAWKSLGSFEGKYLEKAVDLVIGEGQKVTISKLRDHCYGAIRDETSDGGSITDIQPDYVNVPKFKSVVECLDYVSEFKKSCINNLREDKREYFDGTALKLHKKKVDMIKDLKAKLVMPGDDWEETAYDFARLSMSVTINTCLNISMMAQKKQLTLG